MSYWLLIFPATLWRVKQGFYSFLTEKIWSCTFEQFDNRQNLGLLSPCIKLPSDSQSGVHIWPENTELCQETGIEIPVSHCGATKVVNGKKLKHCLYIKTNMKLCGYNRHLACFFLRLYITLQRNLFWTTSSALTPPKPIQLKGHLVDPLKSSSLTFFSQIHLKSYL